MAAWINHFSRSKPRSPSARGMFTPRNTTSVIFSKGLLNAPGDNNCFLNSAVQVLWHLDVFRRSFRDMTGHACMGKACIFCALKALLNELQTSDETVLPPDALRKALATAFKDQLRFQLGCMDDAAECFENILVRIHFHLAHNIKEDLCDAKHCIPHRKFAMTLIEHSVCKCGATSEPFPFTQMVHYVSSAALCSEAHKMRAERKWPNTDHFGILLRKAGAIGDIRDCPSSCGQKISIRRVLMNCPDVVSIGLIWDSDKPDVEHISDVICNLGTALQLRELFDDTVDDRAKANSLFLVGIVTYYGRHYTTFFYNTSLRYWIYFDDAVVKQVGHNWSDVVDRCRRGHFQPLLLLYAYPDGKKVPNTTAPKQTFLLKGYEKDDKENEAPAGHTNKSSDSLSSKVSEILTNPIPDPSDQMPISHQHGNSTSSTVSGQSTTSGQSASSSDSQNTLVYRPVGGVPEFQASSERGQGQSSTNNVKDKGDGKISNDRAAIPHASGGSWVPNSVVEIGKDALNYVPLGKSNGGSYAVSQFALQGSNNFENVRTSKSRTDPPNNVKYSQGVSKGSSVTQINGGAAPASRSQTNPVSLQTGRPSSAKDSGRSTTTSSVPASPQQIKRPSSAQQINRSASLKYGSSSSSSSSAAPASSSQEQRTRDVLTSSKNGSVSSSSQNGAVYNARTGVITGHDGRHDDEHSSFAQPSLTFEPYGNFSTELETFPEAQQSRKLDVKPLQEYGSKQQTVESTAASLERQNSRTSVVRQGSWSSGTSGQLTGEGTSWKTPSVQRTSSLNVKSLDKQDPYNSATDLNNAKSQVRGPDLNSANNIMNTVQYSKYSSVPDLQKETLESTYGRSSSLSSEPKENGPSLKRSASLQSDNHIAPGGILAEAIRNQTPSANQNQQEHHIPLMRSSSITNRNSEEKQARAKYNIQNGFLTLPGKKQMNQFMTSGGKQNFNSNNGKGDMTDSGGLGYTSSGVSQRSVPQLNRQLSTESRLSNSSQPLHDGLMLRQTPEVSVTRGLDIDSIASRDSGYRSRDRSSASSGSVYSLDATSDNAPTSPAPTSVNNISKQQFGYTQQIVGDASIQNYRGYQDANRTNQSYGHVHPAAGNAQNQSARGNQGVSVNNVQRPKTPSRLPYQQSLPEDGVKSIDRGQGAPVNSVQRPKTPSRLPYQQSLPEQNTRTIVQEARGNHDNRSNQSTSVTRVPRPKTPSGLPYQQSLPDESIKSSALDDRGNNTQRPKTPQLPYQRSPPEESAKSATQSGSKAEEALKSPEDMVHGLVQEVECQLLSSQKAENEEDLATALGLCTAAASTLKIALRIENIRDETRHFLQTKYNTTVRKSRGLHRKLTLQRRSEEPVSGSSKTSAPVPPPPEPSQPRTPGLQRRNSKEEMVRRDQESLQEIELLKKRIAELSAQQDQSRTNSGPANQGQVQAPTSGPGAQGQTWASRLGNQGQVPTSRPTNQGQSVPSSTAAQADSTGASSRSGYQPQQYQSVPSSPAMNRNRGFTGANTSTTNTANTSYTNSARTFNTTTATPASTSSSQIPSGYSSSVGYSSGAVKANGGAGASSVQSQSRLQQGYTDPASNVATTNQSLTYRTSPQVTSGAPQLSNGMSQGQPAVTSSGYSRSTAPASSAAPTSQPPAYRTSPQVTNGAPQMNNGAQLKNGTTQVNTGVSQGQPPVTSSGYQRQTVEQLRREWMKAGTSQPSRSSAPSSSAAGRSVTPLGFSTTAGTTMQQAATPAYQGGYRSQTPTAYLGSSTKQYDRSFTTGYQSSQQTGALAGNRNNNATNQQAAYGAGQGAVRVDRQYPANSNPSVQQGINNFNWVERRDPVSQENSASERAITSDTTAFSKCNSAVPQPGGVSKPTTYYTWPRKDLGDNLIDLS